MSLFKEQLAADLRNTFINEKEFAKEHIFDGRGLMAIVVSPTDNPNPLEYAEGVSLIRKLVCVETSVLGYIPRQSQVINLDGDKFEVAKVAEDMGMLTIVLEANAG